MKKWGPGKESIIATSTGRKVKSTLPRAQISASQRQVPAPSKELPTNMADAVISGEEVKLLHYLYTSAERMPDSAYKKSYDHIYKRLTWNYGLSIQCRPIRYSLLAFAAASQFYDGLRGDEDQIYEYSNRAYQALRDKKSSSFGVEEMCTMLFLIHADDNRYWQYIHGNRSTSELSGTQARIAVHLHGVQSLLKQSYERLRASMAKNFGMEVWDIIVNDFASMTAHADGMDLVSMASFWRKHVIGFPTALFHVLSGLVKVVLQEWVDETNNVLRASAERELETYLSLCQNIKRPPADRPREVPLQWRREQFMTLAYYTANIVFQISKGPLPLFIWAKEQVSAALDLYRWRMFDNDEICSVTSILAAALMIPPTIDLQCEFTFSEFSITRRSKESD